MGIISWIVVGLIAGSLGKLLYPGHQGGGILTTLGLGVVGALVGGFLGKSLLGVGAGFSVPGLIIAVLGAMLCIFIWGLIAKP